MKKYRRRIEEVEAIQWGGEPNTEIELWLGQRFESWLPSKRRLIVSNPWGGESSAKPGDWLVKLGRSDFSVFSDKNFKILYEPIL